MKYAVVIVTYNRLKLLKECVDCVLSQTLAPSDIVVINNKSTDGTDEYLGGISDSRFHIFNEPQNGGGAYGFYRGVEEALKLDVDYITLIDDDAMLEKDYLELIDKAREKFEGVKAFSGTVIDNGNYIDTDHRGRVPNRDCFAINDVPVSEYEKEYFEYELSSFCGIVIAKEIINEIGLPKKEYFIRSDDTEYSLRICKKTKIINVNAAKLNHKAARPVKGEGEEALYYTYKVYYARRNNLDIAKTYFSKKAVDELYSVIKKSLLKYRVLYLLKPSKRHIYKYNIQLLKDTYNDSKKGILGKNENYLPGKRTVK